MKLYISCIAAFLAGLLLADAPTNDVRRVWLDELPLDGMTCGYGRPLARLSTGGRPLRIGDRTFPRGVGTHASSIAVFDLDRAALAFDAEVGADAEVFPAGEKTASMRFAVRVDGVEVAGTKPLKGRREPIHLHADLTGAEVVELVVLDMDDGPSFDHADWADAYFTMRGGAKPKPAARGRQLGILTPPVGSAPRINGARVVGVRPGHPVVWRLPVSGERPLSLTAEGLPGGVSFNATNGVLSGSVANKGVYPVTFSARNVKGSARRTVDFVVGDRIALTPPMGWNSWNCFASAVTAMDIRRAVDALVASGLADHGWSYVNIDDYWQNKPTARDDPTLQGPERHPDGTIAVNGRFPDMKGLADHAHAAGLRIGIYSSPGPYTCGGCVGSWKHEWQDAKTYADWGFDYLKYDWCSYGKVAVGSGHGQFMLPYRFMGEALRAQNRDIVFSLCEYGFGFVSAWGESLGGNCWRTTGDITDTWDSMYGIIHAQVDTWPYARPGGWNDPDMLVVGRLGWGNPRPTRLTPNEQYTHVSLWAICCAPLLIGCDLTQLDDFTRSLLMNDEVIEANQDELGAQAARVAKGPRTEVWAKPMRDGSFVCALVNTFLRDARVTLDLVSLGLEGRWRLRDLWAQRDLGVFSDHYSAEVPPHATHLVRLFPEEGAGLRAGLRDIRDNAVYSMFLSKRPVGKPGYVPPSRPPCATCTRRTGF